MRAEPDPGALRAGPVTVNRVSSSSSRTYPAERLQRAGVLVQVERRADRRRGTRAAARRASVAPVATPAPRPATTSTARTGAARRRSPRVRRERGSVRRGHRDGGVVPRRPGLRSASQPDATSREHDALHDRGLPARGMPRAITITRCTPAGSSAHARPAQAQRQGCGRRPRRRARAGTAPAGTRRPPRRARPW